MSGTSSDSSILIATTNPAKREMLAWLLEGLAMRLRFPEEVQQPMVVEETEPTHRGNAVLKAMAWSRACGGMAIASDGGLRIESLGAAWDSVRTARFAGPGADDRARLERLLELMAPYSGEERRARWVEAVAVARAGRLLGAWESEGGDGLVADSFDAEEPTPAFWAGSVWYFPSLGKRYSHLTEEERREVGEPWSVLKPQVQSFFRR